MNQDERKETVEFPLTQVQMAYLMGRNDNFELGGRSTHIYYEFENSFDVMLFEKAVNKMIQNQPMLRAVINKNGTQKILKEVPSYKVKTYDLTKKTEAERNQFIETKREHMSHHVFDVSTWPLFEIEAARLPEQKLYLFCSFDLLISDAGSLMIFLQGILDCYGTDITPAEPDTSFRDYVQYLLDAKNTKRYEKDKAFWLEQLDEFPEAPKLPVRDISKSSKPKFKRIETSVDEDVWVNIKAIAEKKKFSPTLVLASAYAMVLAKWCGQDSFTINSPVTGRNKRDDGIKKVVGDFTQAMLLPVQKKNMASDNFWENAEEIRNSFVRSYKHSTFDGMEYMKAISKARKLGTKAVMPIVFTSMVFQEEKFSCLDDFGEMKYGISQTPQVYLDCQVMERNQKLYLTWDYVEDLFEPDVIETMYEQFRNLVLSIHEDGKMNPELFQLSDRDTQILTKYNQTKWNSKPTTLQKLLMERLKGYGGRVAVKDDVNELTYQELDDQSDKVAYALTKQGVGAGDYVALLAERCINTIVNMVGILKAGAAYVPINPEYPKERIEYIIQHCECKQVLNSKSVSEVLQEAVEEKLVFSEAGLKDSAYVIYTSGSTGVPKGVVISNEAVCNTILDINERFQITSEDKFIGISSYCFDLSVFDVFGSLAAGAMMYIASDARNIPDLIQIVRKEKITVWNTVPAIMELFADEVLRNQKTEKQDVSCIRLVMMSGDWIPVGLPDKIHTVSGDTQVYSLGGATEASIWSIYYPIKEVSKDWTSIPYGYPLANQNMYILDQNLDQCPIGVTGEICIGGVGVAEGYQNDEEKTKAAFIENTKFGKIYKTGDYGVMNEAGYMEFQGRKDAQVKIRGHRIELGEIENVLLKHENVENAVVNTFCGSDKKQVLCAYIVGKTALEATEYKVWVKKFLPDYMVPNYFIKMETIPLTANGKVDKKHLPEPKREAIKKVIELPANEMEKALEEVWKQVLKVEEMSVTEDIFDLGADSLNVIEAVNIAGDSGLEIQLSDVYMHRNIRELAPLVKKTTDVVASNLDKIDKAMKQITSFKWKEEVKAHYEQYQSNLQLPGGEKVAYQNIFLTGSTGYLGSHIIQELLNHTEAHLYLLARGSDVARCEERVSETLEYYYPGQKIYEKYVERVTVVQGNISAPMLGMSPEIYKPLAEKVDCIVHTAAIVSHFGLWENYEKVNINGTKNILDFANCKKKKVLNYISTISTGFSEDRMESEEIFTEFESTEGKHSVIGYCQSKIVCEKMMMDARKEGLDTKIFRVGFLIQDSESGIFQKNKSENALFGVFSMMTYLGAVPDSEEPLFDLTYVDQAAKAIVSLMEIKDEINVYHIMNPHKISFRDFERIMEQAGQNVSLLSVSDYMKYFRENASVLKNAISEIVQLSLLETGFNPALLNILLCDRTTAVLKKLGFSWKDKNETRSQQMAGIIKEIVSDADLTRTRRS